MSLASDIKSMQLRRHGDYQMGFAKSEARRILQDMKNPSAKELVEFYLDTTVAKVKKSVNKAKKYATKAMSTAEKSARKAKKYATKTIKSVIR